MLKFTLCLLVLTTGIISGGINGTIKDSKGNPIAGALVVAEGTDQAALTDAGGKFQLGAVQGILHRGLRKELQSNYFKVDAQGKILREDGFTPNKIYFFTSIEKKSSSQTQNAKPLTKALAKPSAATNSNLLISHSGNFSEALPIDAGSSAPLSLTMDIVSEFAKSNEVMKNIGDIKILSFTDSLFKSIDEQSFENPVCKDGKVKLLPDTSITFYKIKGKTMYQWDPEEIDSTDRIITLLTSLTGNKIGTWNLSGLGQLPSDLSVAPELQAELDSALALQRSFLKVSGTMTIGETTFKNSIEYGVCMGPLLASAMSNGLMTAQLKSCSEVELKYGTEKATWTFIVNNDSAVHKFTYKDFSCSSKGTSSLAPAYSCTGKPDGFVPEDTSSANVPDFENCEAFTQFFLAGAGLGGPGIIPLTKQSSKAAFSLKSIASKAYAKLSKARR